MTDITPTTEQVRSAFANRAYADAGVDEFLVQFDRWLEARDREVREQVADDLKTEADNATPDKPNAYREGYEEGLREAARIARGEA